MEFNLETFFEEASEVRKRLKTMSPIEVFAVDVKAKVDALQCTGQSVGMFVGRYPKDAVTPVLEALRAKGYTAVVDDNNQLMVKTE